MDENKISILQKFKILYRDWIRPEVLDIRIEKTSEGAQMVVYTGLGSIGALDLHELRDFYYGSGVDICESLSDINSINSIFQNYEYEELLADLFLSYSDIPNVNVISNVISNIFTEEAVNRIKLLNNNTLDLYTIEGNIEDLEVEDYIVEINEFEIKKILVFKSLNSMIDFLRFHYPAYILDAKNSNIISDFEMSAEKRFFQTFDNTIQNWEINKNESNLINLLNGLVDFAYPYKIEIFWFGSFKDYLTGINSYSKHIKRSCDGDSDTFMKYLKDDICISKHYLNLKPYLEMPFESTMDMDKDEKTHLLDWLFLNFNYMKEIVNSSKFKTLKNEWAYLVDTIEKELKNWRKCELNE
jgi:hypothetical protein